VPAEIRLASRTASLKFSGVWEVGWQIENNCSQSIIFLLRRVDHSRRHGLVSALASSLHHARIISLLSLGAIMGGIGPRSLRGTPDLTSFRQRFTAQRSVAGLPSAHHQSCMCSRSRLRHIPSRLWSSSLHHLSVISQTECRRQRLRATIVN